MGEGDLREREQSVGADFLPVIVIHQDRENDLLRHETVRQDAAASESGNLGGELLPDGGRTVDQALSRDQTLGEQVAQRRGTFGSLDVDELVVRTEYPGSRA